jgi:hypothetical protein
MGDAAIAVVSSFTSYGRFNRLSEQYAGISPSDLNGSLIGWGCEVDPQQDRPTEVLKGWRTVQDRTT